MRFAKQVKQTIFVTFPKYYKSLKCFKDVSEALSRNVSQEHYKNMKFSNAWSGLKEIFWKYFVNSSEHACPG